MKKLKREVEMETRKILEVVRNFTERGIIAKGHVLFLEDQLEEFFKEAINVLKIKRAEKSFMEIAIEEGVLEAEAEKIYEIAIACLLIDGLTKKVQLLQEI